MSRIKIEEISRGNGYAASGLPFFIGDTVLMRSAGQAWVPCIYFGYDPDPISPDMFRSGENWHSLVAPVNGNEFLIGTMVEAPNQFDREYMERKGLVNG